MIEILENDEDLAQAIDALCQIEPRFVIARDAAGPISIRKRASGYASLVRIIIGQQVSVASASAIWGRLESTGLHKLDALRLADHDSLRAQGLSSQKARYLLELANSGMDFDALGKMEDEEAIKALCAIKGIGRWSAEIYLMFALGRADVIAAGDLALQEAARLLFELSARPDEKEFRQMANAWSPHRNAAAQLLWAYYHVMKKREGIGA